MNKQEVVAFLKTLGAQNVVVSSKWVRCSCVLAPWTHDSGKDSHPSFGVSINDNGESRFNCWACESGDLLWLVQRLKELGAKLPKYDLKAAMQLIAQEGEKKLFIDVKDYGAEGGEDVEMEVYFDEGWLQTFTPALKVKAAIEYLWKRQVPVDVIKMMDIRYDSMRHAVCFPLRNFEGKLVGLRGRYIDPTDDQPRYHVYKTVCGEHNKLPWAGENMLVEQRTVIMVESVFDLARVYQVYRNVVAPLSVGLSKEKILRMSGCLDIVTFFDHGKGGDKARQQIENRLTDAVIQHVLPPVEEVGIDGTPAKDPGNMTTEQLIAVLSDKVQLDTILY